MKWGVWIWNSVLVIGSYKSLALLVTIDILYLFFYSLIQQILIENLLSTRLVTVTEDPTTRIMIRSLALPHGAHILIVLSLFL